MNIDYEKGQIIIYGKAMKYDALLRKLAGLSGEQVYSFITSRGTLIPRRLNSMALISVLNEKIKFLHSESLSKDYFNRLAYYESFTETQLMNLFLAIAKNDEDFTQYKYNLMKLIIDNYKTFDINDGEITYLKNLKKGKSLGFTEYVNYVSAASLELPDTFDGQAIDVLKRDLSHTATISEIQGIAGKYGIDIPDTLTKETYLDFILYYLKKNNYTDYNVDELKEMTLAGLSQFAKAQGVPMQPAMSKEDVITYLFYYLEQCEIPTSDISEILATSEYFPLEFGVEISKISPFGGKKKAEKIIHYAGEEEDLELFNQMLDEYNKEPEPEVIEEVDESVTRFISMPEVQAVEEKLTFLSHDDNPLYKPTEEEIKAKEEAEALRIQEELRKEEEKKAEALKAEELLAQMKEKEKKAKEDAERQAILNAYNDIVGNITKNELYGSKKLKKHASSNVNLIVTLSILGVALVGIALIVLLTVLYK